jgi:hypothetical protein
VGDGLPAAGLFDSLSQVPDQLSLNHTLGAAWQGAMWRGGYSLNRSFQDNRQPGRENADLRNLVHVFNVGAMPSPRLDAGVEFAFEDADNMELVRGSLTRRVSTNLSLRPAARSSVVFILTRNLFEDDPRTESRRTTDLNVTFTQSVALLRGAPNRLSGQFFVRYARQTLYGLLLGSADPNQTQFWSLNTGVSFRVF